MSHHYLESPQTLFSGQGGRMEHRYLHMRQGVIFIEFLLFPLLPQTRFTILFQTRPNWARKVREIILFSVLCTVYCGRGCVSLESERGKELA